ncbi:MAG: HEAT repeat domain-containing protein, partial [Verrucomicrobiales bacterium]|nr:HEAT repeat domain-containing protein [Verrucomicrobiales bacterium]
MKTRRSGWNRGGTIGRWLACVATMCLPLSGRSADEQELLEILRSNAGPVAKAEACKELRVYGSAAAVDALAALLGDARVAHAARHALEGLPFVEATRALRDAVGRLKDAERLGVVDSLGWRRDAESVPVLLPLLKDSDPTTAGAAATALGRIASDAAVAALRKEKDRVPVMVRRAAIEGLLTAAEVRAGAGRLAEARALYAELVEPGEEPGIRVAAHLGAMRASDDGGLAAVVEALQGKDPDAQLAALAAAPGLRSEGATAALAGLLSRTSDAVRVGLLGALRQRRDGAAMDAVLRASGSTNAAVRWAALSALGDLGDATAIPALVSAAASMDPEEQTVARESLAVLRRGDVDGGLIAALGTVDASARREVFRALAARGDSRAAPALIDLARGEDPGTRGGALQALGALAEPKHMAA